MISQLGEGGDTNKTKPKTKPKTKTKQTHCINGKPLHFGEAKKCTLSLNSAPWD